MAEDAFLLWVHADRTDIKTLDDFVKAARAAGDKWIMAGTGVAQEDSMLTDFLNSTYGLRMTYKAFGGGGEVARELAEKRADSTVNNPAEQNQFFPKGQTEAGRRLHAAAAGDAPAHPHLPRDRNGLPVLHAALGGGSARA